MGLMSGTDDKPAAGPEQSNEAVACGETKSARLCYAELTWREDRNRSFVAAGPEFDYRIADRGVFVVSVTSRRRGGRLSRAQPASHRRGPIVAGSQELVRAASKQRKVGG
jgi:hypothetical protein